MKNVRAFVATGVAEAVILVVFAIDRVGDVDLSSWATGLRIALAVSAAVVAIVAYHSWSQHSTVPSICAMLLGLLGGASLVSAVSTAGDGEVYGSAALALVGTVALVASVAVAQIGLARTSEVSR